MRAWAPAAERVAVRMAGREHPLRPAGFGVHEAAVPGGPGDDYVLVLDGAEAYPDPCSRFQPQGVRGPSRVVDLGALAWSDDGFEAPALGALVVYELHVGTFTPEGTFEAAIPRLRELAALGVTAIELMPVATWPGQRGWGYDGLYLFAPHPAYGGPHGLARLVDAAHGEGLAVILDVVYNHLGPGSEALTAFGPYVTERYLTPWGGALNFDGPDSGAVREWAIQNACMWVRDYHVDGLRLDAIHAIVDTSALHVLAELGRRARAATARDVLLIAESGLNDPRVIRPESLGGYGLDAQWADDFHHALHALLTGERDGYYQDFGTVAQLGKAFRRPFVYDGAYSRYRRRRHGAPAGDRPPEQFLVYAQNHDQVGNRALGDRLEPRAQRLAALCVLFSPYAPVLFMGEEYGERRPFQFFTDHVDPGVAEQTRAGRQREFAAFAGFDGEVPDPEALETFERSRLAPELGDPATRALYARLLALRRTLPEGGPAVDVSEERRALRVRRGAHELLCNFSGRELAFPASATEVAAASAEARLERGAIVLAPLSGAIVR